MQFLQMISVPLGHEHSKFTLNGRYLGPRPAGNRRQASVIDLFAVEFPTRNFGNDLFWGTTAARKLDYLNIN